MNEQVFMFDDKDPELKAASLTAQSFFRFFWRELSWERRRIVPALDLAMVKLPFSDGPRTDDKPEYENMWVEDIGFDGDTLTGTLLNSPNWLTSVGVGDAISKPFNQLTDWMITAEGRAYGGIYREFDEISDETQSTKPA